jgi:hypothetical protein
MHKNMKPNPTSNCNDNQPSSQTESLAAIRSVAKDVMSAMYDPDSLIPRLERLRDSLAEARRQGISESEIGGALEEVRQSYPEVAETWPEILGQIEVNVWLEDPDGNRMRGNTVLIDRLVWDNDDEDLILQDEIQALHDDLEAYWAVVGPAPMPTVVSTEASHEVACA